MCKEEIKISEEPVSISIATLAAKMANADLAIHRAVQEIIEMLHFAPDMRAGLANKSLKLQIKTAGAEEEEEACLFHLKLHSSSTNTDEFMSSLTQTQDRELLPVLSSMQLTENESHLCVQYLESPGLITQKSFQVRHGEDQSQLVLHCISTSTKSTKKSSGVTIHIRILLRKHLMMLECQKMYKYLWLYKIFNPKIQLEFNMKIFENLCESDFSCSSMTLSGAPFEICKDASYFMRNTSYACTDQFVVPICSEITQLSRCEGTGDSFYPNTVTLQVVAHMNCVQGRGGGQSGAYDTGGLVNLYLFGPEAIPVFPVLKDTSTKYNPLEQIPWNMYGLNIHTTSAIEDRFSSHFAALLESMVPQIQRKDGNKFALFIHVHFGIEGQTTQKNLDFCAWLHKNYPSILTNHQLEIEQVLSQVVARLLKPHRETEKKTECYTKAIPNMVKSISYILSHSSNEEFRQNCFSLLSIDNGRDVESELTDKLWDIASKRCGVRDQICGVRDQARTKGHLSIKTKSLNSDSVGRDLSNLNHEKDSSGASFTDTGQASMEGGFSDLEQGTSRENRFPDGAKEPFIGGSYTDLDHEMFTTYCSNQGQETFDVSSFADLGTEISAEDGFLNGTITDRMQEIHAGTFTNNDFPEISQENSKESRYAKIEPDYPGSGFPVTVLDTHSRGSFNTIEQESDFTDQGQETLTRRRYLGLGHDTTIGSGLFDLGHETSVASGLFGLEQGTSVGSDFSDLEHETSAHSGFFGLEQGTSVGSVTVVNKTPLIRTDKSSTQDDRWGFGVSNLAGSSRTEYYGESIRHRPLDNHWSHPCQFSRQIHTHSVDSHGRACRDDLSNMHYGGDDDGDNDDKSQENELLPPADTCTGTGPSGGAFNKHGYPLFNINDRSTTGVSSQQNQPVTNTNCFNDLGQHHMTVDHFNFISGQDGDNYSFQGNDFGGENHKNGAGDSFNDVLQNVQQWLDEF